MPTVKTLNQAQATIIAPSTVGTCHLIGLIRLAPQTPLCLRTIACRSASRCGRCVLEILDFDSSERSRGKMNSEN